MMLSYGTNEDESLGSHHPSQEVFMADQDKAAVDNIWSAPIVDQTPDELKATWL